MFPLKLFEYLKLAILGLRSLLFSYLLNTNKVQAHLYGGAPDFFQTENSYIVGIEPGISRTEVRVLTTELRRLI